MRGRIEATTIAANAAAAPIEASDRHKPVRDGALAAPAPAGRGAPCGGGRSRGLRRSVGMTTRRPRSAEPFLETPAGEGQGVALLGREACLAGAADLLEDRINRITERFVILQ